MELRDMDALAKIVAEDKSAEVRRTAVEKLDKLAAGNGGTFDKKPLKALMTALRDPNPTVRRAVATTLGRCSKTPLCNTQPVVPSLVADLKDPDSEVRSHVAAVLSGYWALAAVQPLVDVALKDSDPKVREAATASLRSAGLPGLEDLWPGEFDTNPNFRSRSFLRAQMFQAPAVMPLIAYLQDQNPDIRFRAASALGTIKDPRASESLRTALNDPSPLVRDAAAESLTTINAGQAQLRARAVALGNGDYGDYQNRLIAVAQLQDQTALAEIAKQNPLAASEDQIHRDAVRVQLAAIARLTDRPALAEIANAGQGGRSLAEDAGRAAARLRLVLLEPTISYRVPGAELETLRSESVEHYFPGDKVAGEVVVFAVELNRRYLAMGEWHTVFPQKLPSAVYYVPASVDTTALIGDLLSQPQFTREDLVKLGQSSIPELRAAAQSTSPSKKHN
jgi:HEAT repeat protein